jgi:hypothetical protein
MDENRTAAMTILMFMVSSFGVQAPHHGLQESMAALQVKLIWSLLFRDPTPDCVTEPCPFRGASCRIQHAQREPPLSAEKSDPIRYV